MYVYTEGHSSIAGTGTYLPEQRVTTQEIMQGIDSRERFGVSADWLARVTGIREKRMAAPGIVPSDMAVSAAKDSMASAGIGARQLDAIIFTGVTRDYLEPATAHIVQAKLNATNATVFDISNACNGFMSGLQVMDALIATGQVRYGLVVTGELGSLFALRALEVLRKTQDREQFKSLANGLTLGDAGAAVVMRRRTAPDCGFMGFMSQSQGQFANYCTSGGPLTEGPVFTDMPAIIKESSLLVTKMFREFMDRRLNWRVDELAKYLIHQVGNRVFDMHSRLMGVPKAKMPKTVDVLGNLITANIPVAIHRCLTNKEIREGDKIYLSGTGSGISLSQSALVWDGE